MTEVWIVNVHVEHIKRINLELLDGSDVLGRCLHASKLALECLSGRRFGGSLHQRLAFGRTQHGHLRSRRGSAADHAFVARFAPDAADFGDRFTDGVRRFAAGFAAGFALVGHWTPFVSTGLGLHLGLDNAELGLWLNHGDHLGPAFWSCISDLSSARQQPRRLDGAQLRLHLLV